MALQGLLCRDVNAGTTLPKTFTFASVVTGAPAPEAECSELGPPWQYTAVNYAQAAVEIKGAALCAAPFCYQLSGFVTFCLTPVGGLRTGQYAGTAWP